MKAKIGVKKVTEIKKSNVVNPPLSQGYTLPTQPSNLAKTIQNISITQPNTTILNESEIEEQQKRQIKYYKIKIENSTNNENLKNLIYKLKNNTQKVSLKLKTKFQDDKELLNFTTNMIKIANQLYYFEWEIQGNFTDDGQAKCIGDLVGKLSNVYRLNLAIYSQYFADKGTISLSNAFNKLKNLHSLSLDYQTRGRIIQIQSEQAQNQLQNAISSMPNLELFQFQQKASKIYYDPYDKVLLKPGYLKLSHLLSAIRLDTAISELEDCFKSKSNYLTSIEVRPYYYSFYNLIIPNKLQLHYEFIQKLQMCFNLPYLIDFNITQDEQLNKSEPKNQEIWDVLYLIKEYSNTVKNQISLIIVFNSFIKNEMAINPFQIIIDLLF